VALVISGHMSETRIGFIGVRVFFIISGLLITSLLAHEQSRTGEISLKDFYIRRALRIFPLAYVFIAVVALLWNAGLVSTSGRDLVFASLYTMCYRLSPSWVLAHLWSLSVEEQFYLLWPLAVVTAGKRAPTVALLTVLSGPLLRTLWFVLLPSDRGLLHTAFPNVLDSIALGCLAAFNLEGIAHLAKKIPAAIVIALPFAAYAMMISPERIAASGLRRMWVPLADSAINVLLLVFVAGAVYNAGKLSQFLNWKPMVFVGTISYSLYIWQQLFVEQANPTVLGTVVRIVVIFAVAIAAHYAIEKPFLRLKDRFATKVMAASV